MQKAFLTIVTTVDDVEHRIFRDAEMELTPLSAVLRYQEDGAIVRLEVKEGNVNFQREGDYSLSMYLVEGKTTEGILSFAASSGTIAVETKKIAYTISKNGLLLKVAYALLFGKEKQEMRLRISARYHLEEK